MERTISEPRFSGAYLRRLIWPLMLEQLLLVTVGLADSVMVARCGEAAVSGVSLVDSINQLLIQLFSALATGGAVVVSQHLGRREGGKAGDAAKQLIWASLLFSVVIAGGVIAGNRSILQLIYGRVDSEVMAAGVTYFWLSALSYPFLAVSNAGAALFRTQGNSRVSMLVSVLMNIINIGGNALLIFGFNMGVAGAAVASLAGRAAAAVLTLALLCRPSHALHIPRLFRPHFSREVLGRILQVGVPNGLENSMFHIGKLLVASLVSGFGTAAIAANAVANNVAGLSNVPGNALCLALLPLVGQCVGAGDYRDARHYTRKIMLISYATVAALAVPLFLATPWLTQVYRLSGQTAAQATEVLRVFFVCSAVFWPQSFVLPNALRGAGDAKFTMLVSMLSMWVFRIGFSYILCGVFEMRLLGVWVAMIIDWVVRGTVFIVRMRGARWQKKAVID